MRLLCLPKYGTFSASTRQRFLLYRPHLAAHGIDMDVAPFFDEAAAPAIGAGRRIGLAGAARAYTNRLRALARARDYSLIWLHYEALPYMPGPLEALALAPGVPVVFDFDDANFHVYDRSANSLVRTVLGKKFVPTLRGAAAVICGNDYLAQYATRHARYVTVIPTVVDTRIITVKQRSSATEGITIGWIGSPSTWRSCLEPAVPGLLAAVGEVGGELMVVGAGPAAKADARLRSVEWREDRELDHIREMDIGIMPLNDTDFERGKCGYKLIQYMACGLPTIASPVGVNADIVVDGETGILARTPAEWQAAIRLLTRDPALRRRMGEAGRRRAEAYYSLDSQKDRLLGVLRASVAKGG